MVASTTVGNFVFYLRCGLGMFFFAAAIWTLAPLYRYNFPELRARLKAWKLAIFVIAINPGYNLACTTLEWLVTTLLEFSAMQRIVEASGIPREYFDVLPSIIMLVVMLYLGVRFVKWSNRQTSVQRPGDIESYQEKHQLPGAPGKEEQSDRGIVHYVPPSDP